MANEPDLIRADMGDGIIRLTLNRGPVNALSTGFLLRLAETLDAMAGDAGVRAVVIASAFKVFSAGLDLKQAQHFDRDQQKAIVDGLNVGFLRLFAFPKPCVVAINGAAIAGGLFFVLASDFRVSGRRAKFGLAEVRVGADFPVAPMEIARDTLTPNDLRRLMLTGRPISPEAALTSGIVDMLVDDDEVTTRAVSVAAQMADSPPGTFAAVKGQIRGATIARIETAMRAEAAAPDRGWFSDETRAAMQRMIG